MTRRDGVLTLVTERSPLRTRRQVRHWCNGAIKEASLRAFPGILGRARKAVLVSDAGLDAVTLGSVSARRPQSAPWF